jgi:hypothetical protein
MAAGTGRPSLKFCGEQLGRDDQNTKILIILVFYNSFESPY